VGSTRQAGPENQISASSALAGADPRSSGDDSRYALAKEINPKPKMTRKKEILSGQGKEVVRD
jgi:hypothetical protein